MTLTDEPTAAAQLMNSVAESRAFAGKYINSNARLIQEGEDADELLRLLNLDPDLYRTECGFINLPKVKAALKYPDDYPLLNPATPIPPTPSADTWSGIMEVCRVRGTYGRSDYITTGNRMDNRCNLRVTFDGSELIKAEVARPPNTPDGMRMFAVIDMSAPIPPTPNQRQFDLLNQAHERSVAECIRLNAALQKYENGSPMLLNAVPPPPTPSQQEALDALDNMDDYARMAGLIAIGPIETLRDFILARPDTEGSGK